MVTREGWAFAFLKLIDAPVTRRTKRAVVAWTTAEGTTAKWNPLATTKKVEGSWPFNSVGVQNYPLFYVGLEATKSTLLEPGHGYAPIRDRLRADKPAYRVLQAVERSDWGTGGLALRVLRYMKTALLYPYYANQPIGQ